MKTHALFLLMVSAAAGALPATAQHTSSPVSVASNTGSVPATLPTSPGVGIPDRVAQIQVDPAAHRRAIRAALFGAFVGAASGASLAYATAPPDAPPPDQPVESVTQRTWKGGILGMVIGGAVGAVVGKLTEPAGVQIQRVAVQPRRVDLEVRLAR